MGDAVWSFMKPSHSTKHILIYVMRVRLFISNLLKLHQTLQRLLLLLGMQSFDIFAKHTVRVYYKKYQEDKYLLFI